MDLQTWLRPLDEADEQTAHPVDPDDGKSSCSMVRPTVGEVDDVIGRERLECLDVTVHRSGHHQLSEGLALVYSATAALAIDRAAAALQAAEPEWLTDLLGARPIDNPAPTQVWEDAMRD